jgi:RHS repeat-associated protein
MTDGTGTTLYGYTPITAIPALGANQMAGVDGPLPNDTITYEYDALGRRVSTAINGVAMRLNYDAAGRVSSETNALGAFTYAYDGVTGRVLTNVFPNGLTVEYGYGGNLEDRELQRITHKVGATPISEFLYGRDHLTDRITTWSQQGGATPPSLHTFGYDAADQLLSATVTNSGTLVNTFAYAYDPAGNRLTEQVGTSNSSATYNALNQLSTSTASGATRTNEWDAKDRLVAVNSGNQRTEFTYDGMDRMVSIRQLTNGVEASFRRFVWCDDEICEERDAAGTVTKRFYRQGMKRETGSNADIYFYTRDHLGSIREMTDTGGNVRARYSYDPFGRRVKLSGDLEPDFGFTGLFWTEEAGISVARFRHYDANNGRWLSRDPLKMAELREGPNLYAYVGNNSVNLTDPLGLGFLNDVAKMSTCCRGERENLKRLRSLCAKKMNQAKKNCELAWRLTPEIAEKECADEWALATTFCEIAADELPEAAKKYLECMKKPCDAPACMAFPPPGLLSDPISIPCVLGCGSGPSRSGPDGVTLKDR